jgi:thioredoxin reductase (NADPH)
VRRERIIVVGAGPAGVAAAVQCQRLGVAPLLLDRRGVAGGLIVNGYLIENYPGLEEPLPGRAFGARLAAWLARFGVPVERERVRRIAPAPDGWRVRGDELEVTAGSLILATGTVPRAFEVDADPPARERLFQDLAELLATVPRPRRALVVGGGEAAFDYALSLARAGATVEIAVRGAKPRARGRLAALVAAASAVTVRLSTEIDGLADAAGAVLVRLRGPAGPAASEVDVVLAAVGRRSAVAELIGGPLPEAADGGLTPRPGLFICGDARSGSLGQAGIAVGDGLAAAALAVERALRVKQ